MKKSERDGSVKKKRCDSDWTNHVDGVDAIAARTSTDSERATNAKESRYSPILEVRHLTKSYRKTVVLDDVSLTFEKGKIHGIVGRNGSGKTVLLKCLCGLACYSQGEVVLRGNTVYPFKKTPEGMGVIIETPGFLPRYSGLKNLMLLASLQGKTGKNQVKDAMRKVGLDPESRKRVRDYSLGMRQRLGIAQAFMEGQDILLLDEPMNGLDKQGVSEIRMLFQSLKDRGCTIVLASHSEEDIDILCDTVYELENGRILPITYNAESASE